MDAVLPKSAGSAILWPARIWALLWRWLRPPRRVRPTKAGWAVIGILLALLFGALNSGNNLLYLLLSLLFALIAISGVLSEYGIRRVSLELELPETATAGEEFVFLARFKNRSRRRGGYLLSADPSGLLRKGRLLLAKPVWLAYLPPADRAPADPGGNAGASLWQKALAPARGVLEIEEAYLATRGPFGLFDRRKRVPCGARVVVLPAPVPVDLPEALPPSVQGALPLARAGEGFDLRSLRPYEPGVPARKIAWRASARSGEILVRQMEEETQRRVALVLEGSPKAMDEAALSYQTGIARYLAEELLRNGYEILLLVPGAPPPTSFASTPEDLLRQLLPLAAWSGRGEGAREGVDSLIPRIAVTPGGRLHA